MLRCQIKPINKTLELTLLYQLYELALTPTQINYMNLYLNEDFSLQEIADNFHVSKTAVFDALKKATHQLYQSETKFHLLSHHKLLTELDNQYKDSKNSEVKAILNRLKANWDGNLD